MSEKTFWVVLRRNVSLFFISSLLMTPGDCDGGSPMDIQRILLVMNTHRILRIAAAVAAVVCAGDGQGDGDGGGSGGGGEIGRG